MKKIVKNIRYQIAWWLRPRDTLQNRILHAYPFRMTKRYRIRYWLYKKTFPSKNVFKKNKT